MTSAHVTSIPVMVSQSRRWSVWRFGSFHYVSGDGDLASHGPFRDLAQANAYADWLRDWDARIKPDMVGKGGDHAPR
jgi:hypothetical protein